MPVSYGLLGYRLMASSVGIVGAGHGRQCWGIIVVARVEFIDENGGGPGVRMRKRQRKPLAWLIRRNHAATASRSGRSSREPLGMTLSASLSLSLSARMRSRGVRLASMANCSRPSSRINRGIRWSSSPSGNRRNSKAPCGKRSPPGGAGGRIGTCWRGPAV
jgi:hypothetical protein